MPLPRPARRTVAILMAVAASGIAITGAPSIALGAEGGVVVNEIWYDGSPADAIELFNASGTAVDVSGWQVQDDKRTETGTIPAGTTIEPGAYLVLEKDAPTLGFPFGLGKGDEVALFDAAGTLIDSHAYDATAPLSDWSRCADGGEWAHATEVTLGAANICAAPEEPAGVLLNEIDSGPADWVELINPGTGALDLSGYEIRDNSDDHRWFFAAGSSIEGGARLVVEASTLGVDVDGAAQEFQAAIGIGGSDSIRLYNAEGTQLDTHSWTGHPAINGDEAAASYARCPDATGGFALAEVTPGEPNTCVLPDVAVNEVESNGDVTDWVEIVNTGAEPVDLSGWTLIDSDPIGHAADVTPVAAGITLDPGAFFVFDGGQHFSFGLGGNDVATIRNAAGLTVVEYGWPDHAAVTWARCPDGTGDFADAAVATKSQSNACGDDPGDPGDPEVEAWPGAADVTVLDEETMFLEDSSGLDTQDTAEGTFLWAVDNGTGTFWKLVANADGSVVFADGWEEGKRARFQRDADDVDAAGPDAEGITVDADGRVYLGSERDNSDKAVNQNVVLEVDPDEPGPDVVADQEWDLTASLPQVAANTGIEAVEWVSDAALAGLLVDQSTGAPYVPADYPGHGDGLFFVAVEDNGFVYAYALGADGSIDQVASIDPGLGGVMALDYDTVLGELWAVCDNGCEGLAARIAFTGAEPTIVHVARPAGMPNLNNEGFATSPPSLSSIATEPAVMSGSIDAASFARATVLAADAAATVRPVWWFADGEQPGALRAGTLPGAAVTTPGEDPGTPGGGGSFGSDPAGSGPRVAGGLASTGVDAAYVAIVPFAALAIVLGAVMLVVARRRRA
ncbi:lamin tail domain-containing protein [Agromyces albus]|uniref:LTD domain-containing protein n=1 Tax=Agromyces albus TaxID=205332 RepID=A0A4V1QYF4_9MICO|nr:lamin tail domain-containing protein [Agromyces albus]RXZ72966.1 hypothetical protein ESP51_01715 [Agromyces albus]